MLRLDWDKWIYGLVAAIVTGGASAVAGGFGASAIAPGQFNLAGGDPSWNMLKLMALMFIVNGIAGAAAYLKQSPLPAIEATVTTTQTTDVTVTKKD